MSHIKGRKPPIELVVVGRVGNTIGAFTGDIECTQAGGVIHGSPVGIGTLQLKSVAETALQPKFKRVIKRIRIPAKCSHLSEVWVSSLRIGRIKKTPVYFLRDGRIEVSEQAQMCPVGTLVTNSDGH